MAAAGPSLIEFPADDPDRARRFWSGVLGAELEPRHEREGRGVADTHRNTRGRRARPRTRPRATHSRCPISPWMTSLAALERVTAYGGTVIHPGEQWAICRDSEGSPFGLALAALRVTAGACPATPAQRHVAGG